jgi:hypothetical protein
MSPTEVERAARESILAALRADIARRIRPLVSHLPEAEIATLIEQMARIQYKYDGDRSLRYTPSQGNPPVPFEDN